MTSCFRPTRALLLAGTTWLAACGGGTEAPTCRVTAVSVTPSSASLAAESSVDLTGSVTQSGCSPVPTLAWSTGDAAVATVSATGRVTGVGAGTTTITASAGGQSANAAVTVTPAPVASVTVTLPSDTLEMGATATATAVVRSAAGTTLTGRQVTWSSTDGAATVNSSGVITGVAPKLGLLIRASVDGIVGSATLHVLPTREGKRFAYAHSDQLIPAAAYAPDAATSLNVAGGAMSIRREGLGEYSVLIRRLGKFLPSSRENVFVSTVDAAAEQCMTTGWADAELQAFNLADLEVYVRCVDLAGDPVDARFNVLVLGSSTLPAPSAFFLVTRPVGVSAGQPPWRYTSAGGTQGSSSSTIGSVLVTLGVPTMAASGILVSSTPDPGTCAPATWSLAPATIDLRCREIPGNTPFALAASVAMFERGRTGQRWAFAWSENAAPAIGAPYSPVAAHQRQSNGQSVAVTRTATGTYAVRFPGLARPAGGSDIVMVTAVGAATTGWCSVGTWGNNGADLTATVRCRDAMTGGLLADQQFAIVLLQ